VDNHGLLEPADPANGGSLSAFPTVTGDAEALPGDAELSEAKRGRNANVGRRTRFDADDVTPSPALPVGDRWYGGPQRVHKLASTLTSPSKVTTELSFVAVTAPDTSSSAPI
jgi:hypothetical protein